ncbi:MAG: hypothetical protein LC670_07050, partial [Flavobacteriales bacterium]|nr:hypothetical protein [Flavobacteriales bacterium]
ERTYELDNDGPMITGFPLDADVSCAEDIEANLDALTFTTSCGLEATASASEAVLVSGDADCSGATYEVTYTVTDDCQRNAMHVQTFTIVNEGPMINCDPTPIEVFDVAEIDGILASVDVTSSCGLAVETTINGPEISGEECEGQIYIYTIVAEDACGRIDECERIFLLPPVGNCPVEQDCEYVTFYSHTINNDRRIFGVDFDGGNAELELIYEPEFANHIGFDELAEELYVINSNASFFEVRSTSGDLLRTVAFDAGLGSITAVAYDNATDNLYVGSTVNNAIYAVDPFTGAYSVVASGIPISGGDLEIVNGEIYVTTRAGNRLLLVTGTNSFTEVSTIQSQVNGMALVESGNFVTAHFNETAFRIYNTSGSLVETIPVLLDGAPFTLKNGDLASGCVPSFPVIQDPCEVVEIFEVNQGLKSNGGTVDANRSDPSVVLGPPSADNSPGSFFVISLEEEALPSVSTAHFTTCRVMT